VRRTIEFEPWPVYNHAGTGAAASLTVTRNVMLAGQVTIAGQLVVAPALDQASVLALDAGAKLTAASAVISGSFSVGHASSAKHIDIATLMDGSLLALSGSTVQVGGLLATAAAAPLRSTPIPSSRLARPRQRSPEL
jgi:hypothetical protein